MEWNQNLYHVSTFREVPLSVCLHVLFAPHPLPNMGLCCHRASGGMHSDFCAQLSPSMAPTWR